MSRKRWNMKMGVTRGITDSAAHEKRMSQNESRRAFHDERQFRTSTASSQLGHCAHTSCERDHEAQGGSDFPRTCFCAKTFARLQVMTARAWDSADLYSLRLKTLWSAFRREGGAFWLLCAYLMFEYVRPQSV